LKKGCVLVLSVGLTVDVQPPELETRLAILRAKAESAEKKCPMKYWNSLPRKFNGISANWKVLDPCAGLLRIKRKTIDNGIGLHSTDRFLPLDDPVEPNRIIHTVAKAFNVSEV
jgi:chromosomal replication initiator protein